jgi:hypothetical protein
MNHSGIARFCGVFTDLPDLNIILECVEVRKRGRERVCEECVEVIKRGGECVRVCVRVRESERERQRKTKRQRHTEREKECARERDHHHPRMCPGPSET